MDPLRSRFVVLTWNVCFHDIAYISRNRCLLDICRRYLPDVICFQEVSQRFVDLLVGETWLNGYVSSIDAFPTSIDPYGVVMFCKRELKPHFELIPFEVTIMNRKLLYAIMKCHECTLCVATVHLESLGFKSARREQVRSISSVLSAFQNVILCGDFNFCSNRNYVMDNGPLENNCLQQLLPEYIDMWPAFWKPNENMGYTFDSESNSMIDKPERMRYDRILFKFSRSGMIGFWPEGIRLLGTDPVENILLDEDNQQQSMISTNGATNELFVPDSIVREVDLPLALTKKPHIYPSDHFGLAGQFTQRYEGIRTNGAKIKQGCFIS